MVLQYGTLLTLNILIHLQRPRILFWQYHLMEKWLQIRMEILPDCGTHTGKRVTLKTSKNWIEKLFKWFDKNDIYALAFSHNGNTLAVSTENKEIHLWDVTTYQFIKTLKGHKHVVCQLVFSQDGSILASGDTGGKIQLWELPSGRHLTTYEGHNNYVSSLVFSPDGKTLASVSGTDMYTINRTGQYSFGTFHPNNSCWHLNASVQHKSVD